MTDLGHIISEHTLFDIIIINGLISLIKCYLLICKNVYIILFWCIAITCNIYCCSLGTGNIQRKLNS